MTQTNDPQSNATNATITNELPLVDKANIWAADVILRENRAKLLALKAIEQGHSSEIALMVTLDWDEAHTQKIVGALGEEKLITIHKGISSRPTPATFALNPKKSSKFFLEMGALGIVLSAEDVAKITLSKERTVEEIATLRAKRLLLLEQELFPTHLSLLEQELAGENFVINSGERTAIEDFFGKLREAVYRSIDFENEEQALLSRMVQEHFPDAADHWADLKLFMAVNLLYDGPKILRFWNSSGGPETKRMWTINPRGELVEFHRSEFFSRIQELLFGTLYQRREHMAPLLSLLTPTAWADLQFAVGKLPDYLLIYRQYRAFRYLQSLFVDQTVIRLDSGREEVVITQPLRDLNTGGFRSACWKDPLWVEANYDPNFAEDFKRNFYTHLDEFLGLLVDAKISPSRKKAFLWILARSDSWKGAVFTGIFEERLSIALGISIKTFHLLVEGAGNIGFTSADFRNHWMIVLDDCKHLGESLKLADEHYRFIPKFGFLTRVESAMKVLLNAKPDDQSLLNSDTIDEQVANSRVSKHDMRFQLARFVDHPLYVSSPTNYLDHLAYYCITYINDRLAQYRSLGSVKAGDCAFEEINEFHSKYKLALTVVPISETLAEKAIVLRNLIRDYFDAFDDAGRPYAGRPFNQAPDALKSAITTHVKVAREQQDGTRRLEQVRNTRTPISLQDTDWIVLKHDGARLIAIEYFKSQQNQDVLKSNLTDFIRSMHDEMVCKFPPQGGLARIDYKLTSSSVGRGIAFFAVPPANEGLPSEPVNEDINAQEGDL